MKNQTKAIFIISMLVLILTAIPIYASENVLAELNVSFISSTNNNNLIILADIVSFEKNCDITDDIWTLKPGTYTIPSSTDMIFFDSSTLVIGDDVNIIVGAERNHTDILLAVDTIILKDNGTITTNGGKESFSYGIYAKYFIQEGGTITAHGGTQGYYDSFGIFVSETFTQYNGTLIGKGGSDLGAYGFSAWDFVQEGGTIIATGTTGKKSYSASGVYIWNLFIQKGGSIEALGGDEWSAHGFVVWEFIQEEGTIIATGGEGLSSYGCNIHNEFTQNDGTISTSGGKGEYSKGINLNYFHQNGGTITTNGGEGYAASGICAKAFLQDSKFGVLIINKGIGKEAYGLDGMYYIKAQNLL